MRGGQLKGSITVEAVFIVPTILVVIFSLMYMSLILHDKVVLQTVADEALVRSNQLCHQPSDVLSSEIHYSRLLDTNLLGEKADKHKEELIYYIDQEVKGKLLICDISNITIDLQEDFCQIDIEAVSRISLPMILKYSKNNNQVSVSQQRDFHHPENFARKAEVVLDTVTQIKGMDRIKEFLSKVGDFLNK